MLNRYIDPVTRQPKFFKIAIHAILGILLLSLVLSSFAVVGPQEQGIVVRLGSLTRSLNSGLTFKAPWIEDVAKVDVSQRAIEVSELSYSKDGQTITVSATVNYQVLRSSALSVYQEYKNEHESRLIMPKIKESIKDVVAGYTAQGLLDNRSLLSGQILQSLEGEIESKGFDVTTISVNNLDYDDKYEASIRDKQVAEQDALKQVNITKQEDEKKKQEILKAQALAEKTRLEAEALRSSQGQQLVDKIKAEADLKRAEASLEAAKKWQGILPTHMYGNSPLPFVQIPQ